MLRPRVESKTKSFYGMMFPRDVIGGRSSGVGSLAGGAAARLKGHLHLDVRIEFAKDRNHAIKRKATKLGVADARKLGMRHAGYFLRLASRKLACVEVANDLGGNNGARLFEPCVRPPEVAIDIAAAAYKLKVVVVHFRASFNRLSRSRIRSISICGVLTPDFDFFWKAWITQISTSILTA